MDIEILLQPDIRDIATWRTACGKLYTDVIYRTTFWDMATYDAFKANIPTWANLCQDCIRELSDEETASNPTG